jgi:hypothetical protein
VQLVLLRSLILVDGSLQLTLLPNSPDYLIINLELACPVLQALYPSSSEYLAVGKEESAPAVLQALVVLSLIAISVRPGEDPIACEESLRPLAFVRPAVSVAERSLTAKISL